MKKTILDLPKNIKKILHFTILVLAIMALLFGGLYVTIINLINYTFVFVQIVLSFIAISFGYYCFMALLKEIKIYNK
tara:strand:- start:243 stop:473 length:231 start_codon:yes stop_codon:yes gene_type:complete